MIWIIGYGGQLATAFANKIQKETFIITNKKTVDINNAKQITDFLYNNQITLILNCSGYTNVDKAEEEEELAYSINSNAVKNITDISNKLDIPLIHFSSDYVFTGDINRAYVENDIPMPLNIYGKSKLEGDIYILNNAKTAIIFRISWLYDSTSPNFMTNIQYLAYTKNELHIISDQIGTPTYVYDLVSAVLQIIPQIVKNKVEIYNYSNEGVASWYDFAYFILKYSKIKCNLLPVLSSDFPQKAIRPKFSLLNKTKIKQEYNITIPHWTYSLEKAIAQQVKK